MTKLTSFFTQKFPELDENDFSEVCKTVKNLAYKRNSNKENLLCIFQENGGTCSTKHAFLKTYADELGMKNVKLVMGIFIMNADNTPKVKTVLQKYQLKEIPEAHNYLKIDNEIVDCTRKYSSAKDFVNQLVEEIEIQPNQITGFKVEYHQNFLKNYLSQKSGIPYSLEEFWKIREECIEELSKQKSH